MISRSPLAAAILVFCCDLALADDNRFLERIDAGLVVDVRTAFETQDPRLQSSELRLKAELDFRLSDNADLKTVTRFRSDAFDRLEASFPNQSSISPLARRKIIGDRSDAEIRQFYLETRLAGADFSFGKQQVVWGQADGLRVLDVVNPYDFREFILEDFEDSRIPLWSVKAEIPIDNTTLQLIWIPDASYHKLPEPNSAYTFRAPGFGVAAPPGVDLVFADERRPARALRDSDFGVRASTFWRGWDLTANYFYHYDDFPAPTSELSLTGERPLLRVTPGRARTHLIGGTFSNSFGDLVLRGEVGLFRNRPLITRTPIDGRNFIAGNQFRFVTGLDWFRFSETLISVQLFQDWTSQPSPLVVDPRVATNLSLLLRRDWLNQTLTSEIILIQNTTCSSGLARPQLRYAVDDRTSVRFGADVFFGGSECVFGQFSDRDRIVTGVTWSF